MLAAASPPRTPEEAPWQVVPEPAVSSAPRSQRSNMASLWVWSWRSERSGPPSA